MVGVVFFGVVAMFAVVTSPQLLDVVSCSAVVIVVVVVVSPLKFPTFSGVTCVTPFFRQKMLEQLFSHIFPTFPGEAQGSSMILYEND